MVGRRRLHTQLTFILLILLMSLHSEGQQRIHLLPNTPTYAFLLKSYTTLLDSFSWTAQLLICFWLLNCEKHAELALRTIARFGGYTQSGKTNYLHADDDIFAECIDDGAAFGILGQPEELRVIIYRAQLKITQYFSHG